MTPAPTRRQRLLLRLLLYGGAFFLALPLVFAHLLTRTYRSRISPEPATGYEQVELHSDAGKLRAWLSRGGRERPAVVIVHGLGDNLESYREHARPFRERGYSLLLLDLRGHGGSEGSRTTLGGKESEDVRSAMQWLRDARLADAGLVLEGHSMGAVAVLLAAAGESDLRAVIAEAPFDTYRETVTRHAWLLYRMPSWVPLIPLSIFFAELLADFDADQVDCVAAARRIEAPLLAIVDGEDERMPEAVVRRIVEAHPGRHELWIVGGVGHVGAIYQPEWEERIFRFLERNGS